MLLQFQIYGVNIYFVLEFHGSSFPLWKLDQEVSPTLDDLSCP